MRELCKNQPFSGPIETRIGYADGYAHRCRRLDQNPEYARGLLGAQDRKNDDEQTDQALQRLRSGGSDAS